MGEGDRTLLGLGLRLIEGIKENCNGYIQYGIKRMWGDVPPFLLHRLYQHDPSRLRPTDTESPIFLLRKERHLHKKMSN